MLVTSYAELDDLVAQAYGKQEYATAYELLTREAPRFPEEASTIYYLRSCMAARLGPPDQAIAILAEAVHQGFWYGQMMLRKSPSWLPLQGIPAFEEIAVICLERQAAAKSGAAYIVALPEGGLEQGRTYPLFLALHGNVQTAISALQGWHPVTKMGYILAAIQSSQAEAKDASIWDDQAVADHDVTEQLQAIFAAYPIDHAQIILAGFSMGGETALRLVLQGTIPTQRFLLLGPGGPMTDEPDAWNELIATGAQRGLRGYVLMGERDAGIPQNAIRETVRRMEALGIPCQIEMLPELRHEYPQDEAVIRHALDFLRASS